MFLPILLQIFHLPQEEHGEHPRNGDRGQDPAQCHPGVSLQDLLVLEQEEADQVPDDAGGHVHRPEDPRVPCDSVLV